MNGIAELLSDIKSAPQTITFALDEPETRTPLIQDLVSGFFETSDQVHYIDFDLQYSSLLQNISRQEYEAFARDLFLFQPSNNVVPDLVDCIAPSPDIRRGGLVVLDSLNTLQNLLWVPAEVSSAGAREANHRTAVLVTMVQQFARYYEKSFVITNITRQRPRRPGEDDTVWEKEIVGGRMMRYKSNAILFATKSYAQEGISNEPRIELVVAAGASGEFGKRGREPYLIEMNPVTLS